MSDEENKENRFILQTLGPILIVLGLIILVFCVSGLYTAYEHIQEIEEREQALLESQRNLIRTQPQVRNNATEFYMIAIPGLLCLIGPITLILGILVSLRAYSKKPEETDPYIRKLNFQERLYVLRLAGPMLLIFGIVCLSVAFMGFFPVGVEMGPLWALASIVLFVFGGFSVILGGAVIKAVFNRNLP